MDNVNYKLLSEIEKAMYWSNIAIFPNQDF